MFGLNIMSEAAAVKFLRRMVPVMSVAVVTAMEIESAIRYGLNLTLH